MEFSHIILNEDYRHEKIMILSLNRPERLNAINDTLLFELRDALNYVADLSDVRALIIDSRVMKAFCTGIDVSYVKHFSNEKAATFFADVAKTLEQLIHFPYLTIAAINGFAHGAGADLALACDLRIGSETSSYRFPGPQFGLILGTQRLISELGPSRSRFLTLTNDILDADTALQFGLIHEQVEDGTALEHALKRASHLVQMPQHVVKTIKNLTNGNQSDGLAIDLTKESVLESDFKHRFAKYINKVKGNK